MDGYTAGEEPTDQVTRYDAAELLRQKRGDRQAMMSGGGTAVDPDKQGLSPFLLESRFTSADFFPMFDFPFLHGTGLGFPWDARRARVVAISQRLHEPWFDGCNSRKH